MWKIITLVIASILLFPIFLELRSAWKNWVKKIVKKTKGFTLIELMVVVALLGILSSVMLVSINGARRKSQESISCYDQKTECAVKCSNQYDECRNNQ